MPMFKRWNTIAIPEGLLALGFTDESYGNDACARMEWRPNPKVADATYTAWIEHERREDREFPEGSRFCFVVGPFDGGIVFQTENEDAFVEYVGRYMRAEGNRS